MKIYTLICNGYEIEGLKSWKDLNESVLAEIKEIVIAKEIAIYLDEEPDEMDEEMDKEMVEEDFINLMKGDLAKTAETWKKAAHLSEKIWTDEIDEFYLVSSEID